MRRSLLMKHSADLLPALTFTVAVLGAADDYQIGPDSQPKAGVAQGTEEKLALPACLTFGGAKMDTLYLCAGDEVYRGLTLAKGVRSADAPQKPSAPRL